jgi:hypothetical protein
LELPEAIIYRTLSISEQFIDYKYWTNLVLATMVRYQLATAIFECTEIAIPSGYATRVYAVGKLDVFDAKVAVVVQGVIKDSITIPVLLSYSLD